MATSNPWAYCPHFGVTLTCIGVSSGNSRGRVKKSSSQPCAMCHGHVVTQVSHVRQHLIINLVRYWMLRIAWDDPNHKDLFPFLLLPISCLLQPVCALSKDSQLVWLSQKAAWACFCYTAVENELSPPLHCLGAMGWDWVALGSFTMLCAAVAQVSTSPWNFWIELGLISSSLVLQEHACTYAHLAACSSKLTKWQSIFGRSSM